MTKEEFGTAYENGYNGTMRFLVSRGVSGEVAEETAQVAWARGWEKRDQLLNSKMLRTSVNAIAQLDPGISLRRTTYLSRVIQRWGKLPLMLRDAVDVKDHRYGFIGTEDWFMYPLLQPGSLLMIDETRLKVVNSGWANEFERPIYFLEHRQGYACGWCHLTDDHLILQGHPAFASSPQVFFYPKDIDVIGQVTGVAMNLDQGRRRRARV